MFLKPLKYSKNKISFFKKLNPIRENEWDFLFLSSNFKLQTSNFKLQTSNLKLTQIPM